MWLCADCKCLRKRHRNEGLHITACNGCDCPQYVPHFEPPLISLATA